MTAFAGEISVFRMLASHAGSALCWVVEPGDNSVDAGCRVFRLFLTEVRRGVWDATFWDDGVGLWSNEKKDLDPSGLWTPGRHVEHTSTSTGFYGYGGTLALCMISDLDARKPPSSRISVNSASP